MPITHGHERLSRVRLTRAELPDPEPITRSVISRQEYVIQPSIRTAEIPTGPARDHYATRFIDGRKSVTEFPLTRAELSNPESVTRAVEACKVYIVISRVRPAQVP